jgi:3-phenylpropionate/cinnamic acid dioxygenase small subunit
VHGSAFNYTYCTVHKTLRNIQNDLIHRLREKLNEEITQCEICTMCEVIQLKTSIGYRLAYWQEKNKEDELQYECTPKSLIMNTSGKRLESRVLNILYNSAKIQAIRENTKYVRVRVLKIIRKWSRYVIICTDKPENAKAK